MIADLILGKKGSGKSYYLVQHYILPALKAGCNVYSNMDFGFFHAPELSWCAAARFSEYLMLDVRPLFHSVSAADMKLLTSVIQIEPVKFRVPPRSLLVIDEIQMLFPQRLSHKTEQPVHDFFSLHRHGAIDIVATSQSPKLIDYQIIELFNTAIKVQNLGGFGFGRSTYQLRFYSRWNNFEHDSQKVERYDKDIFRLYKSCDGFGQDEELRIPTFVKAFLLGIAALVLIKLVFKGTVLFSFFK